MHRISSMLNHFNERRMMILDTTSSSRTDRPSKAAKPAASAPRSTASASQRSANAPSSGTCLLYTSDAADETSPFHDDCIFFAAISLPGSNLPYPDVSQYPVFSDLSNSVCPDTWHSPWYDLPVIQTPGQPYTYGDLYRHTLCTVLFRGYL